MYVGVTNNLARRIYEHKSGDIPGFTCKYHVHKLVYFEEFDSSKSAIEREKQIKGWKRSKKDALVKRVNPGWEEIPVE